MWIFLGSLNWWIQDTFIINCSASVSICQYIHLFILYSYSSFFFQNYWYTLAKLNLSNSRPWGSFTFLAHLIWKLKWAFLIACRPSSVCFPSIAIYRSVNFSHFHLLKNRWVNFMTWHKHDTKDSLVEGIQVCSNERPWKGN